MPINQELLEQVKKKAGGDEKKFIAFCQKFPSVLDQRYEEFVHGEGRSVFAHRRKVAYGSGTAEKPPFHGFPLTKRQHDITHEKGDIYFNDDDWWERQIENMWLKYIIDEKPISSEEYNAQTEIVMEIESSRHIRAFELSAEWHFMNPHHKPLRLTWKQVSPKRTSAQNRAQWGVIIKQVQDFYENNWLAYYKDLVRSYWKFKPTKDDIHALLKRLLNNNESTASLGKPEHVSYLEKIRQYFQVMHKHEIKMPESKELLDLDKR